MKSLSRVQPSATLWTAAFQAPLSIGFSRQEYWSGVPLPSPLLRQHLPFYPHFQLMNDQDLPKLHYPPITSALQPPSSLVTPPHLSFPLHPTLILLFKTTPQKFSSLTSLIFPLPRVISTSIQTCDYFSQLTRKSIPTHFCLQLPPRFSAHLKKCLGILVCTFLQSVSSSFLHSFTLASTVRSALFKGTNSFHFARWTAEVLVLD